MTDEINLVKAKKNMLLRCFAVRVGPDCLELICFKYFFYQFEIFFTEVRVGPAGVGLPAGGLLQRESQPVPGEVLVLPDNLDTGTRSIFTIHTIRYFLRISVFH